MADIKQATTRRIGWRLMPLLGLLYLVAYIDRQNISYAKLQMVDALGLSEAAFGLGASLFFIGYFLFEVPSNILLHRMGAHIWFTRIIASWGVVTLLLAFTPSAPVFYLLRFLLGVAEAGFFPGVLYVLTLWFPARYRARAVGLFMLASAVANAVGGAIGGWLLDQDGALGLAGWQWVFLATGLPAILLAPVVFFLLPRSPESARWLTSDQKSWLASELAAPAVAPTTGHGDTWATLRDGRVLLLCLVYIGFPLGAYGLSYWLPTIVRGFGVSNTTNGLLNIIPWTLVAIALWGVPRHAARYRNPIGHAAGPALLGAVLLVLSVLVDQVALRFACLSLAAAIFSGQPVFWTLPPRFLTGARAAAGFAAINSVGNLGGFIAQAIVPTLRDWAGSDTAPMLFLAACLTATGLGVILVERRLPRPG